MSSSSNDGWIESIDPNSGRIFYANRFTRTTQWEPPAGWKAKQSGVSNTNSNNNEFHQQQRQEEEEQPLPDGWEEMKDPKSGRSFYIDHARQITTWERPGGGNNHHQGKTASSVVDNNLYPSSSQQQQKQQLSGGNDDNYFNTDAVMKLNQFGSHSHWDENPHTGSRNNNTASLSIQQHHSTTAPPPPRLNFKVLTIPDLLRPNCPSCFNPFSYTRRRHHCRLCGDIFCDACSNHRTVLPLEGEEFDKAVRVCDVCMRDVKRGNYFSLRRYLTSLELYDDSAVVQEERNGSSSSSGGGEEQITLDMVAASLSSLSTDIDAMLLEPLTSFADKMTIPANVLVTAVARHLKRRKTGEYAIRVLATLLQLGSVVGDDSFGLAVLGHSIIASDDGNDDDNGANDMEEKKMIKPNSTNSIPSLDKHNYVKDVLKILEWSGNDIRTLSAQEQAVKVIYYITDSNFIAGALSMKESLEEDENNTNGGSGSGPVDIDAVSEDYNERMDDMIQIDIHRAFRSMLDHATSSASPSLQRWATACLRHLITEDQRRACSVAFSSSKYESFTSQLVSTGGVMILCSLLNSEDGETRAHATSALEAIVIATREIGLALNQAPGKGRGLSRVGRGTERDSAIVDAIISNVGGSGLPALAHLLISADESVSMMGCSFILSLISPLLTDPRGSGRTLQQCSNATTSTLGFEEKDDGLSSYRNAAIALVVGDDTVQGSDVSCLPSLIEIVRSGVESSSWGGGNKARPLKVQVMAAECIAAVALAIGHVIGMHIDESSYDPNYVRAKSALEVMEQERLFDVALQIINSDSYRSLDSSRDTPGTRLREAAGLALLALSSCSIVSSSYLMSNGAVPTLLSIANEKGMLNAASTVRGKWASKGLCFLEAATILLIQAWTTSKEQGGDQDSSTSVPLNLLLDALNSGAVGLASRLVKTKVSLKSHDLAYSQLRVKIAICFLLGAMFGIANKSHGNGDVGASRLYSAIDADCAQFLASGSDDTGFRTDLVGATLNLLNATLPYAHQFTKEDADEPLPMIDLSEACLLAAGSICGLAEPIGVHSIAQINDDADQGRYSHLRLDACTMACNILTSKKPGQAALLPTVLVGAIGESLIVSGLRLSLAICHSGNIDLCGELSQSGMLVPVGDILQRALASSDYYTFSVAVSIVKRCGQCTVVGSSASGTVETLKSVIRTLSCVLSLSEKEHDITMDPQRLEELSLLKLESLVALEALSANDALQSSTASTVLPTLVQLLQHLEYWHSSAEAIDQEQVMLIGLKTIQRIINIPSSTQSMMNNGIVSILIRIFEMGDGMKSEILLEVALEIMQSIAQSDLESRYWLICSGLLNSLLSMLGESRIAAPTLQLGLQNAGILLSDLKPSTLSRFEPKAKEELLQRVVAIFCSQRTFIRRLIASISDECDDYGESFVFPQDRGGVRDKATEILFNISTLLLVYGQDIGITHFNDALLLNDVAESNMSVATACSALLDAFSDDDDISSRAPANPDDRSFYLGVQLPTVKCYLMEGLATSLKQAISSLDSKHAAEGLIERLKLPRTCLVLCRSEKLAEPAFRLFEDVVLPLPIDFVGDLILCDKVSLVTLFDLVTGKDNKIPNLEYSKQMFATLLGNLAKAGLLPKAVSDFGVRSHAIAALSIAMLLNGGEENIDDNDDSIQRMCLESLAIVLCGKENDVTLTPVESRALTSAIGKVLSSTVLNRFFTQASLEATINDDTVDFRLNREAICQSAEARLLCAMAHSPESLELLTKIGGLEAIGLLAHEREIRAVEAVLKACDMNPKLVVDVDAHLSIMDALIGAEDKLSNSADTNLRVVEKCLRIVTALSVNTDTRGSILHSEQSHDCVKIASRIVSAGAELKIKSNSDNSKATTNLAETLAKSSLDEELQIDDLVHIDSTPSKSDTTPKNSDNPTEELEGVVAYVGSVQFAPGDDWIGIRLTGSSAGKGKNDGSVKGTEYFDCEEKNGIFVKRAHVRKQEPASARKDDSVEALAVVDDPILVEASFALLHSFSRNKEHRDVIMNDREFTFTLAAAIRSSTNMDFKRDALELLSSFTMHYCEPAEYLMELLCDMIETETRSLQLSRDRAEQSTSKHLLGVIVLGLQNLLCCYQNVGDQIKPLRSASGLFIFLSDTLFSGPRSRRMAVSKTDGKLFSNLTSLFLLFLGNGDTRKVLSSTRHVSSLIRFVMMTSGVETMDCHIAFSGKDGEEYWQAAQTHCLQSLMFVVNEASQKHLEKSYSTLIAECEPSSNAFRACLQHISDKPHGGAPAVSARLLLMTLERLS